MEDIRGTFTRRILRRASKRRERDRNEAMNRSAEPSHRRSNILRAINDSSMSVVSYSMVIDDRENRDRSYDSFSDGFNTIGCSVNDDNNNDEKSFDGKAKKSSLSHGEEIPILVKITERNIEVPARMIAELKRIEVNDTFDLARAERSSIADLEATTKTPERRSVKPLSTEAVVEMCNRVSSVFTDIRHESVDSRDSKNTDFLAIADVEAINRGSSSFVENLPEESTVEIDEIDDSSRNKEMPIMPETPPRRSVNALTTEAVVEMCNRVSSVLTDIRHESVDSRDSKNTDFLAIADVEAINRGSSSFVENLPEESTVEIDEVDDSSRSKEMPIMPETPSRRSVNALTTEALVEMCNRVSSVLTDIGHESADTRDFHTDFPTIGDDTNVRSRHFIDHRPEGSTGRAVDFSPKKSAESWDDDKFLKVALGEDRYESLAEEDSASVKARSDRGSIEPIADRSPLETRVIEALNLRSPKAASVRSSNTLDRSMRIYRALFHRIKKKFRPIFRADRKEQRPMEPTTPPRLDDNDRVRELLRQMKIQQTIINQSTRALDLCTSLKQFTASTEIVESERSLLLASLRGKASLEEIKSMTSDEREVTSSGKGEVTISEMSLDMRACLESDQDEIEWFVVVVSHGLKVWATRAVKCRAEEVRVNFPGSVSVANLTPAFKIIVKVYSLKLGRDAYSEADKYLRSTKRHFWRSSSVFGKIDNSESSIVSGVLRSAATSFALSGFTELCLGDLSVSSPWPLTMIQVDSRMSGSIDLNIVCRLRLPNVHEGFVNDGDEAGGLASWNRRWCVLRGHTLKFWNYPREEETKEPLKIIELVDCVSDEVTNVDRKICAKPRTLLIETRRSRQPDDRSSIVVECKSSCTIVRNLISCDSARELEEWSGKINDVIVALAEWNVIGRRSQPSEI